MTPGEFIETFDMVAEAPGGIERLRELVLQLAMQGKLVPQDPNDEPASESLKRIAAVKARTARKGRVKVRKIVDPTLTRLNYHLPSSWSSAHLSDLTQVLNGRAYKKNELLPEGTPVLRVGNLFTSNQWYHSDLDLNEDKYCEEGDLIYAWSASFGPFIWRGPKVIYHYHIWKLSLFSETDLMKQFLYNFLLQKTQDIKNAGHGISMVHMTKEKMEQLIVPLPPLAEQHRIVAKINELMGLIDRLENSRCSREAVRTAAQDSALAALRNAATSEEIKAAWTRLADRMDDLFAAPADLTPLREAVLQLAVRGRLVPQDVDEEPASQLLVAVIEEKANLVKEKKLRRRKPDGPLMSDEIPFEIPQSWVWARLHDLAHDLGQKVPDETFSYIDVSVVDNKRGLIPSEVPVLDPSAAPSRARKLVSPGAVIYSTVRPYLLNIAVIEREYSPMPIASTAFAVLHPYSGVHSRLLFFWLRSPFFIDFVTAQMKGVAYPAISDTDLLHALVPLPPTAEQQRIVAKVDELMGLIDRLERHLVAKEETQGDFAAATFLGV